MADFDLRPMRNDDAADVAALIGMAFAAESVATDPPPSALRVATADIAARLQGGGGAVAEAAGAVVGSLLLRVEQEDGLYMARVSAAPARRRRGIGRALAAAA